MAAAIYRSLGPGQARDHLEGAGLSLLSLYAGFGGGC